MVTLLVALAVLGILFGAAALATYDGDVLVDPHPDDRPPVLPSTALQPEDVAELRFDMALRGYRMSEVDGVLERMAEELAARDARIAELEHALVEPVAAPQVETEPDVPAAPEAFAPLEPAAAAPASISGPLTATTWFTDPVPAADEQPALPDVPEVPVPEPEPEPAVEEAAEPVVSAEPDPTAASDEQTYDETAGAEPLVDDVPEPAHGLEPAPVPEPPALTLPASDDAFSFPELHLPEPATEREAAPARDALAEPAAEVPEPEQPRDWWSSLQEPPTGESPGRP